VRAHELVANTGNRHVYNVVRKLDLEHRGLIVCAICPYNKVENGIDRKERRCWKRYRRNQYRTSTGRSS
jgi:hypothetical protein